MSYSQTYQNEMSYVTSDKLAKDNKKYNVVQDIDGFSKNTNFSQINLDSTAKLIKLADIDTTALKILLTFNFCMDKSNTVVITVNQLAEMLNISKRSIYRSLNTLKERNFIVVIKYQRNNVYFVNPSVFTKAQATYKRILINEYSRLQEYSDSTDKNVANLDLWKNEDQLTFKKRFFKSHEELLPPADMDKEDNKYQEDVDNGINRYENRDDLNYPELPIPTLEEMPTLEELNDPDKYIHIEHKLPPIPEEMNTLAEQALLEYYLSDSE